MEASLALPSPWLLATVIQDRRHNLLLLLMVSLNPMAHRQLLFPASSRPSPTARLLRLVSLLSPKGWQVCRWDKDSQRLSRCLPRLVSVP